MFSTCPNTNNISPGNYTFVFTITKDQKTYYLDYTTVLNSTYNPSAQMWNYDGKVVKSVIGTPTRYLAMCSAVGLCGYGYNTENIEKKTDHQPDCFLGGRGGFVQHDPIYVYGGMEYLITIVKRKHHDYAFQFNDISLQIPRKDCQK